jgi:hypothetical protein
MKDFETNTEEQAGRADRASAYQDADFDYSPSGTEHEPCETPECLVCVILPRAMAAHRAGGV